MKNTSVKEFKMILQHLNNRHLKDMWTDRQKSPAD
jgi:hypothetical protein